MKWGSTGDCRGEAYTLEETFRKGPDVPSKVTEDATSRLLDRSEIPTPEVTRDEVESAVKRLRNGKAGGKDGIVAEILKNGGM